jgi:hypothetical protein
VRSVLTLVDVVSDQNDTQGYFLIEHRDQAAVLAGGFLGFGADPLEFFLGVFRDDMPELGFDSFPQMVVVVFVYFLDFDEVVEDLVSVDNLQTV